MELFVLANYRQKKPLRHIKCCHIMWVKCAKYLPNLSSYSALMIKFAMTRPMARKLQARTRSNQAVCFKGELSGFTNVRPTCVIIIIIAIIIKARTEISISICSGSININSPASHHHQQHHHHPQHQLQHHRHHHLPLQLGKPSPCQPNKGCRNHILDSSPGKSTRDCHLLLLLLLMSFLLLFWWWFRWSVDDDHQWWHYDDNKDSDQNANILSGKGNEGGG